MRPFTILAAVVCIGSALNVYAQDRNSIPPYRPNQPFDLQVSNVTIGNETNAQKLLWIYKYYEANMLDKIADMFADDVVANFPDGTVVKGKKKLINAYKDARNRFISSKITVDACVTLKSPDVPDREAVSIWSTETATMKDGSVIIMYDNEVYSFNNEGKVIAVRSMSAKVNE